MPPLDALPSIRTASLDDAHGIARVQVESSRTTYAELFSAEYLDSFSTEARQQVWSALLADPGQVTLVATVGAEIVGFANGGPNRGQEPFHAEVYAIYLVAACQRVGVGRHLMGRLVHELSVLGHDSLIVWVLRDNPFRQFYERLGGAIFSGKRVSAGGRTLDEVSYAWPRLPLIEAAPTVL
jgi:GNAT superfamily N-acetyltransferase